jgi:hypothetical protein
MVGKLSMVKRGVATVGGSALAVRVPVPYHIL